MKYDLDKLESELLSYKLDKIQREVLEGIIQFLEYPLSFDCCVTGRAGSGKTQLMKILVQILKDNNIPYIVISPTNKSKNVIASVTNTEAITVHTLLSLQPNLNILELDFRDLKFESKEVTTIKRNSVWIIDECSMINDTIYELVVKKATEHNCKIVFLGDPSQLAPVKQQAMSKTFNSSIVFTLKNVYRQDYYENDKFSAIGNLLETLRVKPIKQFSQIITPNKPSLYTYKSASEFIQTNLNLFEDCINLEDPSIVRLISYTNKRIESFNSIIRNKLFNNPTHKFLRGEILTGYDTCDCCSINSKTIYKIENSVDYVITDCERALKEIAHESVAGWKMTLYNTLSSEYIRDVFVIDPTLNKIPVISHIICYMEKLRLDAIKVGLSKYWKKYFNTINQFLTPVDLTYQGRIIKRKSIDYGYCITVHKSQASQYDTILVDMENIFLCPREKELRQLQYVALSRSRGDIHLYQK